MIGVLAWIAIIIGALAALAVIVAKLFLSGEDLTRFDFESGKRFAIGRPPSAAIAAGIAHMQPSDESRRLRGRARIVRVREEFDSKFADAVADVHFAPFERDGVHGEWVLAPGADPARRTLFIHGGGFILGSPRSHRSITARFSEQSGGAVLALDYRLMPEHTRRDGINDCRNAYRWMLEHGPDGTSPAQAVFVAGDSAGANLTLSLIAWVRDTSLRAPDAAVALSPPTDTTLASPSIRANMSTDLMLGPVASFLGWVPRTVTMWHTWFNTGIRPNDPLISPVFGDLSHLPPTLVHVSETEMLYDDARRYVNRARAAGSPATLHSWNHTLHVWHMFNPELPEANEALAEIGTFLTAAAPPRRIAP